jgi:hypothetical protein
MNSGDVLQSWKSMRLLKNKANGVDIIIERDADNSVRILTGKPDYSIQVWKRLRQLCDDAIIDLEIEIGDTQLEEGEAA